MNLHGNDLFGDVVEQKHKSKLGDEFLIPPFTVLSAREGWWQDRKRAWLALGIQSELGRGEDVGEKTDAVAGNGWANGGPARRDAAFYEKKRKWEADNGREISTTEFREKYWDGAADAQPKCSVCGEPQFDTPAGASCANGHGGADAA
jgi:hypothetical protein